MNESRFGSYILIRQIATGGMAEIFEAKRTGPEGFQKTVAIKRILPALQRGKVSRSLFTREAHLAAELNHPNIVQIYDFGETNGTFFLAMEYVHGANLSQILTLQNEQKIRLLPVLAVFIVREVLSALQYAHTRPSPIIHRDVSPSNVLISSDGKVKLADFGIAKSDVYTVDETLPGTFKGKIHYAAPEQIRGEPVDVRTDLYSAGILLYTLLAHRRPFEGKSADEILRLQTEEKYPPLQSIDPQIPEEMNRVVRRALQSDPSERYQSCTEFLVPIERFITQKSVIGLGDRLASHVRRVLQIKANIETEPEAEISRVEETRNHEDSEVFQPKTVRRGWSLFLKMLVLGATSFGVYHWLRSREVPMKFPVAPTPIQKTKVAPQATPQPTPKTPPTPFPAPTLVPSTPVRKPTLKPSLPKRPSAPIAQFGRITIMPDGPFATVSVDGKLVGDTPILNLRLSAGRHELKFENEKLGLQKQLTVTIEPNQELRLKKIWDMKEE